MNMNSQIMEALQWRYAVKQFDTQKKVSEADWKVLAESLRLAPSSYGLQPWKFIVVQNPSLRAELRKNSWNQSQVTDCSHYVVLTTRTKMSEQDVQKYIAKISQVRGVPQESLKGYHDMMIGDVVKGPRSEIIQWWAQRQAYIAFGFLMETAALMKIDTCPIEGLEPKAYDQILKLEGTGYATVAACAVGYRHRDDKNAQAKKVRFDAQDVIEIR
ncbi:MAG: NAD(P)H-dependent oxidoreductase [Proteobacteria bacterium]|jgi:nitroreductase|nr:NAD(P)H-dependent oxidoreductase [Pseudomonadota bacterium]